MEIKYLEINSQKIDYKVVKSNKATRLRLQIVPGGELELIVPDKLDFKIAQNFLESNKDWIQKNISRLISGKFYFLGKELFVIHQIDMFCEDPVMKYEDDYLIVSADADYEFSANEVYKHWLKYQAKKYIPKRVQYFARKYGFEYNRISIRNQRTRWGSCSSKGNLNFNFFLMKQKKSIIDYVIVHELCHLKELNHSKKFWAYVAEIIPDYKRLRKELKGFR